MMERHRTFESCKTFGGAFLLLSAAGSVQLSPSAGAGSGGSDDTGASDCVELSVVYNNFFGRTVRRVILPTITPSVTTGST